MTNHDLDIAIDNYYGHPDTFEECKACGEDYNVDDTEEYKSAHKEIFFCSAECRDCFDEEEVA